MKTIFSISIFCLAFIFLTQESAAAACQPEGEACYSFNNLSCCSGLECRDATPGKGFCVAATTPPPASTPAPALVAALYEFNEYPLSGDLASIVNNFTDLIFKVAVIIAPIMMLVGGFFFATAGGNSEQITKGKKIIFWTLIGFLVTLLSRGVTNLLIGILGGS